MEARRRQRQRCPTPSDAVRQRAVVASLHKISVHHDVLVRIQATCDMLGSLLLQAMGNQSELHFYRSASTSLATGLLI